MPTWTAPARPRRLTDQAVAADEPDPLARAGAGLVRRTTTPTPEDPTRPREDLWLRCVAGRPVSAVTTQFLGWGCAERARRGQAALGLIGDHAGWPLRRPGTTWIHAHNRQVKQTGKGVRLLVCRLPTKRPWLTPIEPKWGHGKRRVIEPDRLLTATALAQRGGETSGCADAPHLTMPEKVA